MVPERGTFVKFGPPWPRAGGGVTEIRAPSLGLLLGFRKSNKVKYKINNKANNLIKIKDSKDNVKKKDKVKVKIW